MTISEKVAYLKGLAEGMKLSEDKNEDKMLLKILEVLGDLALDLEDTQDAMAELAGQLDEVDEDLALLEDDFYDDDDCDCDCCDCDCDDDDCDCCDCGGFDDDMFYEVTCPTCNTDFELDEETLLEGSLNCPNCGESLEFDIQECDCDDECGCCGE